MYEEPVNNLVHQLKYGAKLDLAGLFSRWFMNRNAEWFSSADCLIPVPLHSRRLRARTYNQSLEMAAFLSRLSGIPVLRHSLKKKHATASQAGLSREERLENLKGAFVWDGPEELKNKKIILIDDVFTTGSTLQACALALKRQEPQEIGALTVAMQLRKV